MRETRTDRRSLRTRRLLMEAMVDLMRRKRYDAITVQEIADRADVGRSTFYAHFTDKDDLLTDGVRRMTESLAPEGATAGLALFRHVGANADLYRVLARSRGLAVFLTALHEELATRLADQLASRVPAGVTPVVPVDLLAAMTTGMLITTLRKWVEGGLEESPETIDRAFRTAADAAITAGLRPGR